VYKCYRVNTYGKPTVDVVDVIRVNRGTVVYIDSNGTQYKDDEKSKYGIYCKERSEAQKFINDEYYRTEKLARDKKLKLTNLLREVCKTND
jgi:hypothetical protein